jgi:hypothetical protein
MDTDNKNHITPISLDTSFDDVEGLPSFGAWPTGGYKCIVKVIDKKVNDDDAFEVEFICKEVIELAEKETMLLQSPKPGDKCTVMYKRNHKVAMGLFKNEVVTPFVAKFPAWKGYGDLVRGTANGVETLCILKREPQADGKEYMRIKQLAVV